MLIFAASAGIAPQTARSRMMFPALSLLSALVVLLMQALLACILTAASGLVQDTIMLQKIQPGNINID
jgi:hypothetical protein